MTLLPIGAAIAVIPLTASLALKLTGSTRTALLAASLAAFNPYLVMLGPTIRAYSLLAAFSLLAINEFFHWNQWPGWWSGVRCAVAVLFLLLAHLHGIYIVAFLVLLLIVQSLSGIRRFLWESRTLLIPLGGVAIIVSLAYWRLLPDMARVNKEWGGGYTPTTSMGLAWDIFRGSLPCTWVIVTRRFCLFYCSPRAVGRQHEASNASSAVRRDHCGSDSHVVARS